MDYQLEQTGDQVQNILNTAPTTEQDLRSEITRSTNADESLETAIGNEKTRAEGVEGELQTAIGNEKTRAEGVEGELQTAISNEKTRAEGVEGGLRTDVDAIDAKIPTGASSENKLATESFVNSSISTNTADFKGTYPSLEALETAVHDANANDYAFVVSTDAAGNTVYNRYKYVDGTGWVFEYALNNSSFTSAQWAAINSAITAALVAKLAGLPTATELTAALNDIITSVGTEKTRAEGAEAVLRGSIADNATAIATEKTRAQGVEGQLSTAIGNEKTRAEGAETVLQGNIEAEALLRSTADGALQLEIDGIDAKIPTAASASNQLADKVFVNSSIATNTATFKGTYNSVAALDEVTADNNDYAFVVATDSAGNTVYNRYKYVDGTGWAFEYALNNSSFTATQWAAIQSGITAALVVKLSNLPDATTLASMFSAITSLIPSAATSSNKLVDYAQMVAALATKQNTLTFDSAPVEDSVNPVTSGGLYTQFASVTLAIAGLETSKQDVLTFDAYPTAGSDNPVRSTGIYSAIQNAVTPKADQTDLQSEVERATLAEISLSGRISTNEADIANLQAAYAALTQSDPIVIAPTDTWPVANPQQNKIYRVVDRTNTPPQYYTDYMWNGSVFVQMAQYNNGIDETPTAGSHNLVESGGVQNELALGAVYDVSAKNPTAGPNSDGKFTLEYILDQNNVNTLIPVAYRKGGMSIKFVCSSDNKYVQYRLMAQNFTTDITQWQGVDSEPTVGSDNLVKSGGIFSDLYGSENSRAISFNSEDGKLLNSDGTTTVSSNWAITDFIDIENFYKINVVATQFPQSPYIPIQLYDENKNVIQNITGIPTNYTFNNNGYKYLRASYRISDGGTISVNEIYLSGGLQGEINDINTEIYSIQEDFLEVEQDIEDIDHEINGTPSSIPVEYTYQEGLVLNNGVVDSSYSSWGVTDYIEVNNGDILNLTAKFPGASSYFSAINLYNADKSVVGNISIPTETETETYLLTIENAKYIRVNFLKRDGGTLVILKQIIGGGIINEIETLRNEIRQKPRIDKNINFVGMSIWWYDGKTLDPNGFMGGVVAKGYQTLLKEQFKFLSDTDTQYCYSGYSLGGLTNDDNSCIMNQSSNWAESDNALWTLDTITNDFKRNIPIGTINDYLNKTGILTYYGALREFKDKVASLSGGGAIVICSNALHRNNDGYTSTSQNTNGDTLTDFEYALMNVAARNNWYFVDQFRLSGITDDSIMLTTLDGLHLNNFGYTIAVKPWIEQFDIVCRKLRQSS